MSVLVLFRLKIISQMCSLTCLLISITILMFFLTVRHSIDLFHLPTLVHNSFIH